MLPSLKFLILISTILILKGYSFYCPNGSDQLADENLCALGVNQSVFYPAAVSYCASKGGMPVKIQNALENVYIQALLKSEIADQAPFIGVERNPDGSWTYSGGQPLSYVNWATGEPNKTTTNMCAIMDPESGKWKAVECTDARPFYCSFIPAQCAYGWVYSNKTDFCYYLQNFTYPDGVHWQLYNFSSAEAICQRSNAHLVSIHSSDENDFIRDLILTNVKNLPNVAPNNDPCPYQWAWIGLYGNGTLGVGNWTDGSPVDYTGGKYSSPYNWIIRHDVSCSWDAWIGLTPDYSTARFVCKMPSASRLQQQRADERMHFYKEFLTKQKAKPYTNDVHGS